MRHTRTILVFFCTAAVIGSALGAAVIYTGVTPWGDTAEARDARQQQQQTDSHDHKDDDHRHNPLVEKKQNGKHDHDAPKNQTKQDAHGKHDAHDEMRAIRLSDADQREFGIQLGTAGPGALQLHITLPGEVSLNADRRAHVVPRLPGIVRQVHKTLGEQVRAGEVMAVLDSRELADLQSAYLTAKERVTLAEATFRREADLWQKKITSEQEFLDAKQALTEANLTLRAAEQKMHAIGFSEEYLAALPTQADTTLTRYAMTAPFAGTVIEKHITLGEALKDDTNVFVIADLTSVWVDLKVYRKDLPFVRPGQPVVISAGPGIADAQGTITFVAPVVGEQTRTALARIVLPNRDGRWRPGLFITGTIEIKDVQVPVRVPKSALQTIDERSVVFVNTDEGFVPQPVALGRTNRTYVEVTEGLQPGQQYVTQGAFTLKAQLAKGSFGDGHNH